MLSCVVIPTAVVGSLRLSALELTAYLRWSRLVHAECDKTIYMESVVGSVTKPAAYLAQRSLP